MNAAKRDDEVRLAFAAPVAHGTFDDIDLALLDPADEDQRALLIRAEHPELAEAIERGDEEIEIDSQAINPRLHLTIHQVLAKTAGRTIRPRSGKPRAGCWTQATSATRSCT